MSEEIDKDFVINVLTNDGLNKLRVTEALHLIQKKVKENVSTQVNNMNEVELKTVFDSIQEALKDKENEDS